MRGEKLCMILSFHLEVFWVDVARNSFHHIQVDSTLPGTPNISPPSGG